MNCSRELTVEEWKKIIGEVKRQDIKGILFSGGEPLIRLDEFLTLAEYTRNQGIKVSVYSNGTLIDRNVSRKLTECLDEVTISLDGPVEEVNDKIRGVKGSFKRTVNGIKDLVLARNGRNKPYLRIHTTVSSLNVGRIKEMVELAERLEVDAVSFQYLSIVPNEILNEMDSMGVEVDCHFSHIPKPLSLLLTEEDVVILRNQLKLLNKDGEKEKALLKPLAFLSDNSLLTGRFPLKKCYSIRSSVRIGPGGDVYPCPMIQTELGNIMEQPLDIILQKSKRNIKNKFPVCNYCCVYICNWTPFQMLGITRDVLSK